MLCVDRLTRVSALLCVCVFEKEARQNTRLRKPQLQRLFLAHLLLALDVVLMLMLPLSIAMITRRQNAKSLGHHVRRRVEYVVAAFMIHTRPCQPCGQARATHRPSDRLINVELPFSRGWPPDVLVLRLHALQCLFSIGFFLCALLSNAILPHEKSTHPVRHAPTNCLPYTPKICFSSISGFDRPRHGCVTFWADVSRAAVGSKHYGFHAKGCITGGEWSPLFVCLTTL